MSERESKIINESTTDNLAALAYRAAQVNYTIRDCQLKEEAKRQNIDLTPVKKVLQRTSSIEMAQDIKSRMDDPSDISEFVEKLFRGPLGYATYEVEVVEATHDKADLEYHYCPLVLAWQKFGLSDEEIAETCDSAMKGDVITAEEMGYDLDIQKTIARGDGVCKLVYTRKQDKTC